MGLFDRFREREPEYACYSNGTIASVGDIVMSPAGAFPGQEMPGRLGIVTDYEVVDGGEDVELLLVASDGETEGTCLLSQVVKPMGSRFHGERIELD